MRVLKAQGDGSASIDMPIKPEFTQTQGHAHGGAVGTLADVAVNLAHKQATVTVEYKINFLNPAQGQRLRADARVKKAGKKLIVAEADVFAINGDDEKLVASCLATLMPVG